MPKKVVLGEKFKLTPQNVFSVERYLRNTIGKNPVLNITISEGDLMVNSQTGLTESFLPNHQRYSVLHYESSSQVWDIAVYDDGEENQWSATFLLTDYYIQIERWVISSTKQPRLVTEIIVIPKSMISN
jgi:hypothetical protein